MQTEVLRLLVFAVWVQDLRTRTYFGGMCDFSKTKKMISRRWCFFFKVLPDNRISVIINPKLLSGCMTLR